MFLMDSLLCFRVPKPLNKDETCDEPALEAISFLQSYLNETKLNFAV